MGLREEIKKIAVKDQNGKSHTVQRITTFESGRVLGGGDAPVGERYVLDDGATLNGNIDGDTFIDMASGRVFKPA